MADTRKIVIELKNTSASVDNSSQISRHLNPKKKKKTEEEIRKEAIKALGVYATKHSFDLIKNSISVTKNRYFNMSENYILENEIDNFMTIVGNTTSVAATALVGAKVGMGAGPVGMAVGAGVGAAVGVAANLITYQSTKASYYSSLNATNMQTEWSAKRAGLWDEGRGTEN